MMLELQLRRAQSFLHILPRRKFRCEVVSADLELENAHLVENVHLVSSQDGFGQFF